MQLILKSNFRHVKIPSWNPSFSSPPPFYGEYGTWCHRIRWFALRAPASPNASSLSISCLRIQLSARNMILIWVFLTQIWDVKDPVSYTVNGNGEAGVINPNDSHWWVERVLETKRVFESWELVWWERKVIHAWLL